MPKTPIELKLDGLTWVPVPPPEDTSGGLPYVTHEGTLEIPGFTFKCYQLSNGRRVLDADSLEKFWRQAVGIS